MNPTDLCTPKTFSVEMFDTESNRNVIHVYHNYEHYHKDCIGLDEYYNEKCRKQIFNQMDWRDKEMIIRIKEQKQKDEEYQRQKQARYHKYILKKPTQS